MKVMILSILAVALFIGCAKMPEKVYIISGLEQNVRCRCGQKQGKIELKSIDPSFWSEIPNPILFDSYDNLPVPMPNGGPDWNEGRR